MSNRKTITEYKESGETICFWTKQKEKVSGTIIEMGSTSFVLKSGNTEKLYPYLDVELVCGQDTQPKPTRKRG